MTDKKITVELEEKDVREDMIRNINMMQAIRQKEMKGQQISDETKNEYLHLSYRIASLIEGLSDEALIKHMDVAVERINKNPALLYYDYTQEGFWKEIEPEFSKSLDTILISLKGDSFSTLEDKHHILNALKYLASKNQSLTERLKVYDAMLPYNSVTDNNREVFMKELSKVINPKHTEVEGLTLKVTRNDNIENLLEYAPRLGFTHMQTVFAADKLKEVKEKFEGRYPDMNFKGVAKEPFIREHKESKTTDFFAKAVKYTKPLSYLVLGALPASLQKRIEKRFNESSVQNAYNGTFASRYHNWTENLATVGAGIYFSITFTPWMVAPTLLLLAVQGVGRAALGSAMEDSYVRPAGDLLGKALFFPLEKYLDHEYGKMILNPQVVEFKLKDPIMKNCQTGKTAAMIAHNYQPLLETLAAVDVGEENEENLKWTLENHHTQSKYFAKKLENAKVNWKMFDKEKKISREESAWTFYDVLESGQYKKVSAITCLPKKRYAMTYITQSKDAADFSALSKELTSDKPFEEKIKTAFELTGSEYFHMSHFENREKKDDMTITR